MGMRWREELARRRNVEDVYAAGGIVVYEVGYILVIETGVWEVSTISLAGNRPMVDGDRDLETRSWSQ